jgi:protein-tyrosine kinase
VSLIQKAAQKLNPESLADSAGTGAAQPAPPAPSASLPPTMPVQPAILTARPAAPPPPRRPSAQPGISGYRLPDDALAEAGQIAPATARTRLAEEVRLVLRRVLRKWAESASAGPVKRCLMVTSAEPREGKSFTSLNLAMSCALEGLAVTLIDADLAHRHLSQRLQAGDREGLSDYLRDPRRSIESLLLRDDRFDLSLLAAGPPLSETEDIPRGNALREAIVQAERRRPGGIVILDTPPVLSSSIAGMLADCVGTVLLVVKANATTERSVEAALGMLEAAGDISLLLNQASAFAADHRFGTYAAEPFLPTVS